MKTTQHTPGPWRCNGSLITAQADMALSVASIYNGGIVGNAARDKAEAEANARLIVAAPELLSALYEIENTIRAMQGNPQWEVFAQKAQQLARAAIAKARGTP